MALTWLSHGWPPGSRTTWGEQLAHDRAQRVEVGRVLDAGHNGGPQVGQLAQHGLLGVCQRGGLRQRPHVLGGPGASGVGGLALGKQLAALGRVVLGLEVPVLEGALDPGDAGLGALGLRVGLRQRGRGDGLVGGHLGLQALAHLLDVEAVAAELVEHGGVDERPVDDLLVAIVQAVRRASGAVFGLVEAAAPVGVGAGGHR
jgi:hypothetical protein